MFFTFYGAVDDFFSSGYMQPLRSKFDSYFIILCFCAFSWLLFFISFFISGLSGAYTILFLIPPMVFLVIYSCVSFLDFKKDFLDGYAMLDGGGFFWVINTNLLLLAFLFYLTNNVFHLNISNFLSVLFVILFIVIQIYLLAHWRPKKMESIRLSPTELLKRVSKSGISLYNIPCELRTREICMEAVKQDGSALEYVPDNIKDREMCMIAIKKHVWLIESVPDTLKDREMCMIVTGRVKMGHFGAGQNGPLF